jgi:hypothetical protein
MRKFFGHGAPLLDSIFFRNFLELTVRGIPSYVLMTLGGAGLFYLASRRWYPGASAVRWRPAGWVAARMEFLGKESLLFLVVHWLCVSLSSALGGMVEWTMDVSEPPMALAYLRGGVALVLTLAALPPLARLRDRWSKSRRYGLKVGVAMGASLLLIGYFAPRLPPLAYYLTFITSFGFAFVYPYARGRLRQKYTTSLLA